MANFKKSLIVSVLFTLFGGPGISLFFLPLAITRFHIHPQAPAWHLWLGGALIALGLIPALESVKRFVLVGRGTLMPTVPTEHLVVSGFYRFVRNPMYCGVLTALVGENLLFWQWGMLLYLAVWWFLIDLFIRKYEEPTLRKKYGAEYELFCRNVQRWRPRRTPWLGA
jgi:protein-S-isoprenylcysteine O-methyltransferase Ste14